MTGEGRRLAVAIHDVEPATYERCALIRDWLDDHGVARVTLLVIPAPHLHPFFQHRELTAWLLDCRDRGDAIAQHGVQHRPAEFAGLSAGDTAAGLAAGRRMLRLAGVEPRGFVAPAYAYTPALRRVLADDFDWWATLTRFVDRRGGAVAPAVSLRRSPLALRAGARAAGGLLRLDIHPGDLDRPRHVLALEGVLRRAEDRRAVTYDELGGV